MQYIDAACLRVQIWRFLLSMPRAYLRLGLHSLSAFSVGVLERKSVCREIRTQIIEIAISLQRAFISDMQTKAEFLWVWQSDRKLLCAHHQLFVTHSVVRVRAQPVSMSETCRPAKTSTIGLCWMTAGMALCTCSALPYADENLLQEGGDLEPQGCVVNVLPLQVDNWDVSN